MTNKNKILIFLIFLSAASFIGLAHRVEAAADLQQIIPQLRIPIPDILTEFQQPTFSTEGDKSYVYIPWIAQYISAVYRYSLVIASVISVIAVMIGGFLYLTSAGFPSRIEQGKKFIFGAITGMVIIISSYVLLNLINPELVRLKPIKVQTVVGEVVVEGAACENLNPTQVAVITPTGPARPDQGRFACAKPYDVTSINSQYVVPTGQQCRGGHCEDNQVCTASGCVQGLFYGTITQQSVPGFGLRYVDTIYLFLEEDVTGSSVQLTLGSIFGTGSAVETGKAIYKQEYGDRPTSFFIPRTPEVVNAIKENGGRVMLGVEINDTGQNISQISKELYGDFAGFLIGKTTPTIDDDYFIGKSAADPRQAAWIQPQCKVCFSFEVNESGKGYAATAGCQMWSALEVVNSTQPIEVNIRVGDFLEDYNTQSVCDYSKTLTKTDAKPGGQCLASELYTVKKIGGVDYTCRPVTANSSEWTRLAGAQQNEVCDNFDFVQPNVPLNGTVPGNWNSTTTQVTCADQNTGCSWAIHGATQCESSTPLTRLYCYGRCLAGGNQAVVSAPGERCAAGGVCGKYAGDQLICNYTQNICQFGEWGDQCVRDADCKTPEYRCDTSEKACVRTQKAAQQWQHCIDNNDCPQDYSCLEAGYTNDLTKCKGNLSKMADPTEAANSDIDYGICWPNDKIDADGDTESDWDVFGVCYCTSYTDCQGNVNWPEATFCNTGGDNYCTKPIAGARCDDQLGVGLPSAATKIISQPFLYLDIGNDLICTSTDILKSKRQLY